MSGRMRTGQVTAGPSREAAYGVALSQEVKVTDRPVTQQVGRCGITSSFQAFSSVSTKLLVSVLLCVCVQHASHPLRGHGLTFGWRCQTSLVRGSFTSFVCFTCEVYKDALNMISQHIQQFAYIGKYGMRKPYRE